MPIENHTPEGAARLRSIPQLLAERPALASDGAKPDRWIRRLIHERRIAFHKVGGRVLLDLDDVDELLVAGRIPARHEEQNDARQDRR